MKKLTIRIVSLFVALDLLFGPLVAFAYLQLLGAENRGDAVGILAALLLCKIAACAWFLTSHLAPHQAYADARGDKKKELVARADRALQTVPRRFSIFYAGTWIAALGVTFLIMRFWATEHFALIPEAKNAVLLLFVAIWFGGFALAFPLLVLFTAEASGECSVFAREQGVSLDRESITLQSRIGVIALALGLGPMIWIVAVGYMAQLEEHGQNTQLEARLLAGEAARSLSFDGARPERTLAAVASTRPIEGAVVFLLSPEGRTEGSSRALTEEERAWSSALLARSTEARSSRYDKPTGRAIAFERLQGGYAAIALLPTSGSAGGGFLLSAAIFAVVVALWAPICALTLARAVSGPIERLTWATQKIVEEGNQTQMSTLPTIRNDEVGLLSDRFNDLLDMMRDLSHAADSIARGNLGVNIDRVGELPDAFGRMLEGLRTMVRQIRQTSVELAGAATEIFAASQEQEAAATSQSSAMTEISHTMDSLSESAAHVSEAVQGVLSNAEQTLVTTDSMVERIESLSAHTGRITELLDVIRDIADKSDLLALNGSLEASRAGEGGQGFALVAAEMRRLAERVTASVQDVKKLLSDVRESSASTIMATEESRRLARSTTEAARQITFVSQQQRTGTEQVSESVKEITDMVTQAAAATSQTRTSAQNLKEQADLLASLVQKFEVSSEAA